MMETGKLSCEQISILADGELEDEQVNRALHALRDPAQHATWTLYHQIGDALRCEQMATPLSADFSARMAARLDAEPTLLAPRQTAQVPAASGLVASLRRLSHSSGTWAAVAAAALAFVLAPQMLPTQQHAPQFARAPAMPGNTAPAAMLAEAKQAGQLDVPGRRAAEIDGYILAHQTAYPSLYGSAQLARPATLNEEPAH